MPEDVDPHEETSAEPARPNKGMAAGAVIGGYQLIEVLGEGGMGVVWAAHDPTLDRRVAIKVLKRGDAAPSLRKRLLREARAMARLKHQNVLTVYEVGTEGDRDYIAMELVEGGSLDEWLDKGPPRDEAARAMLAAGRGLAAAHAAGLVHRDFKPHNVLRSREGRVLVTDFGLARGMGEDSQDGTPVSLDGTRSVTGNKSDSVLDSPLTQTGALIGTPAYMAPEQFLGAAPDPRTDQFAFCVTAWQALTGARPYTGSTIDELRKAASAGVAPSVKVDLAPDVRAALVRGLDPDPAKRWPTLDDLLDVLDHAVRPRRSRWLVPALALGVVALVAGAVLIARRNPPAQATVAEGCAPGEDSFAGAWSPQARAELAKAMAAHGVELSETEFARVADPLDAYRARWTQQLAAACKAPEKIGEKQRACLIGARDQVAVLAVMLRDAPAPLYAQLDMPGMLPDLGGCAGDNPNVPPHPPDEPVLRDKIIHVLARALTVTGSPAFEQQYPDIEREAAALGWPPVSPLLAMVFGNELLRRSKYPEARAELAKVLASPPDTRETRTVAIAYVGMFEAATEQLEQPGTDGKPGELHPELARLLMYAHSQVKAAGGTPTLVANVAGTEARAYWELAQFGRYPKAYAEALGLAHKAAQLYRDAGDVRRAGHITALAAQIMLERGGPAALDDAMFETRTAAEAIAAAQVKPMRTLDRVRAYIELERGNYQLAEDLYAGLAQPRPFDAPVHTGTVTNRDGKPIAGARVVAWRGELIGDPRAAVTDRGALTGEVVESGGDGTFSIHAAPTDALVAEVTDLRSLPVLAGTAPSKLALRPTVAFSGSIDQADLANVFAFARWHVGDNTWEVRAPINRDRTFHVGGLPEAPAEDGLYGDAGQAERRVIAPAGATALRWPTGEAFEVIVRGAVADSARVRAGAPADRAIAELRAVGADNTDAGRAVYQPGDLHAVITGNAASVEVCVARPTHEQCLTAKAEAGHSLGVTPVIFPDDGGTPAR